MSRSLLSRPRLPLMVLTLALLAAMVPLALLGKGEHVDRDTGAPPAAATGMKVPEGQPDPRTWTTQETDAHAEAFASLMTMSYRLSVLADSEPDLTRSPRADRFAAEVDAKVAVDDRTRDGVRLCVTGPQGEYLVSDTSEEARVSLAMGIGECDFSGGLIAFKGEEITGGPLLTEVRHRLPVWHQGRIPMVSASAKGPAVSGRLLSVTAALGERLAADLGAGRSYTMLDEENLDSLGWRAPRGVRLAEYVARNPGDVPGSFSVCLSTAEEFVWFEGFNGAGTVTLQGRGRCDTNVAPTGT